MAQNPKGLTFHREYYPDMDRMVKALKIVLALPRPEPKEVTTCDPDERETADQDQR